jgi:tetratricopeptide (TPR) repeat protein
MLWGRRLFAMLAVLCCWLVTIMAPSCAWGLTLDSQARGLAHYMMAVCYELNDQTPEAIGEYQRSVKANGLESAPRLKLGAYYLRLDRVDQATTQLKAVTRLDPGESQAHYLLALIYSSEHKYDLAASEYEIVLKYAAVNRPANTQAYLSLGQLYYAQGKLPQAIEQFSRIIKLEPDNTIALYLLGSVYADHNDSLKAIEIFRRVLELAPDNDEALNSLGYMYAEVGSHLDEALSLVRRAIKIDPLNGAYYDSLGWVFYKKGMYARALTALQKAATYIQDPLLYEHMGDVYKAQKNLIQARKFWRKSLDLDPHQDAVQKKIQEK